MPPVRFRRYFFSARGLERHAQNSKPLIQFPFYAPLASNSLKSTNCGCRKHFFLLLKNPCVRHIFLPFSAVTSAKTILHNFADGKSLGDDKRNFVHGNKRFRHRFRCQFVLCQHERKMTFTILLIGKIAADSKSIYIS